MTNKLILGVACGAIVGALLGWAAGNTPIGIAVCVIVGAVAAYVSERITARKARQEPKA